MDFITHFTLLDADQSWIQKYLDFVTLAQSPVGRSHRHHILPRSMFPKFASFKVFPSNCKRLTPSDHFIAHYYLYRALPKHPVAYLSFLKMASVERLSVLAENNYNEALVREISLEYERIRSGAVTLDGWAHVYNGKLHTVCPSNFLDKMFAEGWTQQAPPRQWVHKGEESYRIPVEKVPGYLEQGFNLGRPVFHTTGGRKLISKKATANHQLEAVKDDAYSYLPRGDQHHRRILGCPDEVADKISKTLTDRTLAPEHAAKVRVAAEGKHWAWSHEARVRKSESMQGAGNNRFGKEGYWKNKTRPISTRQKMSNSHKKRQSQTIS